LPPDLLSKMSFEINFQHTMIENIVALPPC
jgi:hypothetical protein